MMSIKLPLWLRLFLLIGIAVFAAGAGLLGYRYYTRPTTLTVAVGSIDGEATKAMSAIAGEPLPRSGAGATEGHPQRHRRRGRRRLLCGKVYVCRCRGDVGDLLEAEAVVVVSHTGVLDHRAAGDCSIEQRGQPEATDRRRHLGGEGETRKLSTCLRSTDPECGRSRVQEPSFNGMSGKPSSRTKSAP